MARFVLLKKLIVNLEAIAVVRAISSDTVAVVTSPGHVEYVEGKDAVDLLAHVHAHWFNDPNTEEPDRYDMELAREFLQESHLDDTFEAEEDGDDE